MKILIANDGSRFGEAAVKAAIPLINGSDNVEALIVTVVEPAGALVEVEAMIESVEELTKPDNPAAREANEIGEASVKLLKEKCPESLSDISHITLAGPPAQTIVEKAEDWGADLIVMGSHGGFWKRALLGSVSIRVLNHARCSVLIVKIVD
jgi:nucleotide-binding universal stress UspA family protein